MSANRKTWSGLVLAVCCAGMFTISFGTAAPALCLPTLGNDLHLDRVQEGMFLASPAAGVMIGVLLAGPLADRLGPAPLLLLGSILQCAGLWWISLAHGLSHLVIGGVLMGMGGGMPDALATPIACLARPDRRSGVANLLHAFFGVGVICVVPFILLITHLGGSWRLVFRILGMAALPYGLLAAFLDMPRVVHQGDTRLPTRRLLARPAMWGLLTIIFLGGATELGPSGWLPTFVQSAGGGPNSAALSLLLFGVMLVIGRLGASKLAHRTGALRLIALAAVACVALSLAASLAGVIGSPVAIITALSLLGLGVSVVWPTTLGSAGDRFPQAGASMYGALSAAGNAGCVVGPYVIGVVADRWGLSVGMAVLAIGPASAAVLAMLLRRPGQS